MSSSCSVMLRKAALRGPGVYYSSPRRSTTTSTRMMIPTTRTRTTTRTTMPIWLEHEQQQQQQQRVYSSLSFPRKKYQQHQHQHQYRRGPCYEDLRVLEWPPATATAAAAWAAWLSKQKVPKGFENFFPKQGAAKPEDADTAANEDNDKTFMKDDKQQQQKKKGAPPPPPPLDESPSTPGLAAMLLLVLLVRSVVESDKHGIQHGQKEVTFAEFRRDYLRKGRVDRLEIVNKTVAKVYLKPNSSSTSSVEHDEFGNVTTSEISSSSTTAPQHHQSSNQQPFVYFFIGSVESLEEKLAKAQHDWHPADWIEVLYVTHTNWALEAMKIVPLLAMGASLWYASRIFTMGGGTSGRRGGANDNKSIFGIGKSTAKKIVPTDVNVTFADVAGCQQAKQEVMEFVDFLQHPARFQKLGAKIPKGALLSGPPGTGKTLLAKAVAGEAGVPFYSISGSDFIEMFVGVGPSRVRDLFKEARQNSPCIVFIDEIDAVGRQRGRGGFSGGNDERENTLNQLLVEMDGFSSSTNVVVLAGTNRPDILDQALTRPGRFDRQISVDKPDLQGRKEIFLVHLKGIKLQGEKTEYAGRLAGLTPGFAGADIANLVNEAAICAARRKGTSVTIEDFEKAADRIIGGLESSKIMSDSEKTIVAHHEAGHAVAGWFLEHADPLLKVTIIPRSSGALGFAQYLPKEVFLRSRDQIMDIVCMALAGRAAEQVFFGEVTTGASDDLRRVTQLVYSTIKVFGMNSRLGQLVFPDNENQNPGDKKYSESTAEAFDEEARAIVEEAYQRTLNLITERKEEVRKVAQLLREKETITHDDIVELIGARPYGDKAYQEYISSKAAIINPTADDDIDDENEDVAADPTTFTPGLA